MNYRLFCLFSASSDAFLTFLLIFVGHIFFDVINVCCCCFILLFVLTRSLNIGISHESNASFFTPLSYLLWRLFFHSYTNFFLNRLDFLGSFLSVPHLVEAYMRSHITEPPCYKLFLYGFDVKQI